MEILENNYKFSKYNIVQKDIDENYVLYNLLSNEYCIITNKEKLEQVKKLEYIDPILLEKGFVVKNDFNELVAAEKALNDKINPNYLNLFIVPTRYCNFDCAYCYEEHKPFFMNEVVEDSIIEFIENNIKNYTGLIVTWFGGEPTVALNKVISISKKIKTICNKEKKPYYAVMNTNAYELTGEVMEELLKYNFRHFQICIDGTRETHNKHRKHVNKTDSFDKIMNNLKDIKKIKRGFRIVLRTNVTKEIMKVMDEYINLLYESFGDDNRFYYYWETAKDHGGERIQNIINKLVDNEDEFIKYVIKASKLGMKFDFNQFVVTGGFICSMYPNNYWLIDYNGKIQKCTVGFDNDDIVFGNVCKGKINIDYDKLNKWMNTDSIKCKNCEIYPACGGFSCPYGELDNTKIRNCNRLRQIFYNIVMMNYYNKREYEDICTM